MRLKSLQDSESEGENGTTMNVVEPQFRSLKVLSLSSRGIPYRHRHLMMDIVNLLPTIKKDNKFDSKSDLSLLNELAELNNCTHIMYFESRKREDLYLWLSKLPNGPSIKFLVLNVHTMDELHFSGNCMNGTRPILSFDKNFDDKPEYQMIKEFLTQIFGIPEGHKKAKQYYDHIFQFSLVDDKIWFRNYQIHEENDETSLIEIGPRFVLSYVRVFESSFWGRTLAVNSNFVSPNMIRSLAKEKFASKYSQKRVAQENRSYRIKQSDLPEDELSKIFH